MKVLAIRFSSMGDIALLAAAAKAWLDADQEHELLICSRPQFKPLFEPIKRCEYFPADLARYYKGLYGMKILADHLVNHFDFDHVADLHDSLRSRVLSTFLRFQGFPISRIQKGRKEKRKLTRRNKKELYPLPHTIDRYLNALPGEVSWNDRILPIYTRSEKYSPIKGLQIGLAPYAKHAVKQWPEENFVELVRLLAAQDIRSIIFGSKEDHIRFRSLFPKDFTHIQTPEFQGLENEIDLMTSLDAFVALDSFNMHLAYLCGLPVVSIWGPTHPNIGFGPLGISKDLIIQTELECRPCSTFGQKKCYRGDHACMSGIEVASVFEKVKKAIEIRKKLLSE